MKQVYLAGDMLTFGSRLQREQEKEKIEALGITVYSPKDDKEINDKSAQTIESNNGLAERIVEKDTDGIFQSDTIVIEPQPFALGTQVELGQILGMMDVAKEIEDIIQYDGKKQSAQEILDMIKYYCNNITKKKVFAHMGDIRRTDIPEVGDRRSWGVNQYVYGAVLKLTDGRGFQDFDEILSDLTNEK